MPESIPTASLVACVGDTCVDVSLLTGEAAIGGNAVNMAVNLLRNGIPTAFVGRVGPDDDGHRIIEGLREYGIPSEHTVRTPERTIRAYLSTNVSGHTWVSDVEGGQGHLMEVSEELIDVLAGYRHVYAKGVLDASRFLGMLRERGVETSYDYSFFHDELGDTAADIVFYSAGEGKFDAGRDFAVAALERGAHTAISTFGVDGCMALTADGDEVRVRIEPVEVVDSIGAGDAFIGGFLAARFGGASLEEALRAGSEKGAAACLHALAFTQETWRPDVGDRPIGPAEGGNDIRTL